MRNAVLKSISHNISIWLSFVYRKTMRIWEMQVKNRRQEKVCVSNLNFAFFKKEQKGKEQKERDKSRNPARAIYCIPTEQNSFSVVIHT